MGIAAFGKIPGVGGRVGLFNLGNTCFFNATVQSLAHTDLLISFFFDDWRKHVNHENRLSTEGHLANAFALIVDNIWKRREPVIFPQQLFETVIKFKPIFGDHAQHDAQELLMFLLDGIHQDLNRVTTRGYIEGIEGDIRDEEMQADAAWKRHKLANDSIIVDIFHGQLRTKLICPCCNRENVVFDPYVSVTLPLPTERLTSVRYFYTLADPRLPRHSMKIQVKTGAESECIASYLQSRFNAQNPVVVGRDVLTGDYGVKIMPQRRGIEYFVFDIPDTTKLYCLVSVYLQYQVQKFSSLIDGPLLIEAPTSFDDLQETVERQMIYLWEDKGGSNKSQESRLADEPNPELFQEDRRISAIQVHPDVTEFVPSEEPLIATQSLKVVLNPKYSRESKGFS
jgi:ubiquitin carboxyl-terminal hydrolase 4/11/15